MKMNLVEINLDALEQAVTLVVGPQIREAIRSTYYAIDAAERRGFDEGFAVGIDSAERDVDQVANAAFDTGYGEGYADGSADQADLCDCGIQYFMMDPGHTHTITLEAPSDVASDRR